MFTPIQVILIITIVLIIFRIFIRYRQKEIIGSEFLLWLMFWLFVSLIVIFKDSTNIIAHFVGIGRGVDLIFAVSTIVIMYIIFKILLRIEKIERNITKIVRKIADDKS